ncbi:MAG: iron ABC transporter permease [Chloroflexi bacterium]|nr:iron ABC transporter permease [Ardenticatenaceae bacterium]MBL1129670.1 iron ABC transporter permease [Chloroflexota bacterium]NOG35750.1 iron ABC transporter permease [Chloroflexota bacterium]
MSPKRHHLIYTGLLAGIPLLFLAAFFFWPLANILRLSVTAVGVEVVLVRPYFRQTLWFTLWQAVLSTGLTLLMGLPAAYLFARYTFPGRSLLRALTTVPFVMPTVVVAAAFRALLGSQGLLNQELMLLFDLARPPLRLDQTIWIILLAHVFYNTAIVVRLVGGFWAHLNPRLNEAARTMGASRWRAFREVTLPLLRPSLLSASLLIFLFTFTSFGVILLLGGPMFGTLETEIYRQYVNFLRPDIAAVLALFQIVFTFVVMMVYTRWQQNTAVSLDMRAEKANLKRPTTWPEKIAVATIMGGLCLFLVTPLLALVWQSLVDRDGNLTLAYYQALSEARRGSVVFIPPLTAVRNSIGYALLTVLLAGSLGLMTTVALANPTAVGVARWRAWADPLFMLPLGASAVTLGFGYVVTYSSLRTSAALVLIAHTLVALPFVMRSLLPVMQSIQPGLREAAAVMGATPGRVWREVDLPIIGRALLVASVFAFTVSMGEFGATSFIIRPNSGFLTMPIAIARFLSTPGGALNFGQAMAMSVILMAVSAAGFIAIERFRYADIGEF